MEPVIADAPVPESVVADVVIMEPVIADAPVPESVVADVVITEPVIADAPVAQSVVADVVIESAETDTNKQPMTISSFFGRKPKSRRDIGIHTSLASRSGPSIETVATRPTRQSRVTSNFVNETENCV